MFCHKCGAQSIDDSEFCHKCGAKLVIAKEAHLEHSAAQNNNERASTITQENQQNWQTNRANTSLAKPKKHMPIIISSVAGVVILLIIIIAVFSSRNDDDDDINQPPADSSPANQVNVSQNDIGSTAIIGDFELKFLSYCFTDSPYHHLNNETFIALEFNITNTGTATEWVPSWISWYILYDNTYTFTQWGALGDEFPQLETGTLNPLSSTTGYANFIVPDEVVTSNKPIVLVIKDGTIFGTPVELHLVVRAAGETGTASTPQASNNSSPQNNAIDIESLADWLAVRPKYIKDEYEITNIEPWEGGWEYYVCNDIRFLVDPYMDMIVSVEITNPRMYSYKGTTLDKTRSEIITAFGTPAYDGDATDYTGEIIIGYYMVYELYGGEYNLYLEMEDFNSKVYFVSIDFPPSFWDSYYEW